MSSIANTLRCQGFAAGVASAATVIVAALGGVVSAASPAEAQYYYYYGNKGPGAYGKPKVLKRANKQSKKPAESIATGAKTEAFAAAQRTGPLVLVVSIRRQRVSIYDANGLVTEAPISSGRVGYPTPQGVFTILEKNKVHYSNLYDSAPMPNMQRITWSGVALHAGDLPGYAASHGCIRLPRGFSAKLFEMTRVGDRVIVTGDQLEPARIAHDKLFAAYPSETTITTGAILPNERAKVADASGTSVPTTVLGVTAAAAADAKNTAAVKLSPYREAWLAEMMRREQAVLTAGTDKSLMSEKIAAAAKDVDAAKAALKSARAVADKDAAEVRKAQDRKAEADRKLAAFAKEQVRAIERKSARALEPAQLSQLAEEEDQLEKATFELAAQAEAQREVAERTARAVKSTDDTVAAAVARQQALVAEIKAKDAALAKAVSNNEAAKRREAKRNHPVSVLVSRKEQKLFVRQGYEPVLEMPVSIANPDQPIGTHIFTAHAIKDDRRSVDWSVVTLAPPSQHVAEDADRSPARKGVKVAEIAEPAPVVAGPTASDALDRVTIPEEARGLVEDAMKPGSSLIISDLGIGNETGKFTDFIVQTSGSGSGSSKKKSSYRKPNSKPANGPGQGIFFW